MAHQYTTMVIGWIDVVNNVQPCRCSANGMRPWSDVVVLSGMFFNAQKFQYICLNPHASLSCNVYTSSFEFHITNLNKRTTHFTGWILRTLSSRDKLTMLTLFKALVMSRLDYGSQLWSPYLTKHINMLEKTQRSLTRYLWYARSVLSRETYCF